MHAIRKIGADLPGGLHRQARLADAAGTSEGDQPHIGAAQQVAHNSEVLLAPTLKGDDIVVMDNFPAHKAGVIAKLIQARGARRQLLPPYSPDCNPIELCWAKIKTALRAAKARTLDALLDALKAALLSITPSDALAWLQHCGYCVHP
jgi:transposase